MDTEKRVEHPQQSKDFPRAKSEGNLEVGGDVQCVHSH